MNILNFTLIYHMLFLYLRVEEYEDDYDVHAEISNIVVDNRCAIYYKDYSHRLYVLLHVDTILGELQKYETLPLEQAANINFTYRARIPTGSWREFIYPYVCDASIVYSLIKLYNIFSHPINDQRVIDSMLLHYYKERYNTIAYNEIMSRNSGIKPMACTPSDIMRIAKDINILDDAIKEISYSVTYDTVSNLIYALLGDRIVCTSPTKKTFYVFSHVWNYDESYSFVYRFIMERLCIYIRDVNKYGISDVDEDKVSSVINNKREEIITRVAYKCESKHFLTILDSKTDIIAFNNGVYDFRNGYIRESSPDDYLSISIPHNLVFDISTDQLMEILRTIFPNEEILEFFLDTMSLVMGGRNYEKLVIVWLGRTDSGKSTCQEFLEYILGEYCGSLPSSMFVGKRNNPHGTTSAISSIGSKRLLFLQEPEDSRINSSQIKSMSSNDKLYMREVYQKATVNRIKAITVIVTNGRIDLSACDEASLSRLVVIPFVNTFGTSRLVHHTSNYKADVNMIDKLILHSEAMLHILVERYQKYILFGYNIPDIIKMHTTTFIRDSNPILYFMNECLRESSGSAITISSMYSVFSVWYRESYPGSKAMSIHYFKETIMSSGYDINGNTLSNYMIK